MSDYQTILTDVADKVATIWLNRPEQRNSFYRHDPRAARGVR